MSDEDCKNCKNCKEEVDCGEFYCSCLACGKSGCVLCFEILFIAHNVDIELCVTCYGKFINSPLYFNKDDEKCLNMQDRKTLRLYAAGIINGDIS